MREIIDETGRRGVVDEDRGDGLFARPLGTPYLLDATMPGVGAATLITTTWWARRPDGTLRGLWYDSRHADWRTAREAHDA